MGVSVKCPLRQVVYAKELDEIHCVNHSFIMSFYVNTWLLAAGRIR